MCVCACVCRLQARSEILGRGTVVPMARSIRTYLSRASIHPSWRYCPSHPRLGPPPTHNDHPHVRCGVQNDTSLIVDGYFSLTSQLRPSMRCGCVLSEDILVNELCGGDSHAS